MPGRTVGIDLAHNFVHRHGIGVSAELLCGFGQFMLQSDLTGSVTPPAHLEEVTKSISGVLVLPASAALSDDRWQRHYSVPLSQPRARVPCPDFCRLNRVLGHIW
jgi:hypothetical protein